MLSIHGLVVRLAGLEALAGVDLAVAAGETVGLIGPNGSGKTTLFNAVSGVYAAAAGQILVDGEDVAGLPVHAIARHGVARTFQNLRLLQRVTALENVAAALIGARGISRRAARDLAWRALERVGLAHRAGHLPGDLALAEQRRLEVARALVAGPRLLLLDEPAGGMTPSETAEMADLLQAAAAPSRAVVIIEHKVDLIASLCDRVAVLDFGRKIAEGSAEEVLAEAAVQAAYLGEDDPADA